jgi:hypothetical protein
VTDVTTIQMIESLRNSFGALARMDPEGPIYRRLCNILDRADDVALLTAKDASIKFVSSLALNRCIRRGLI